MRGKYILIIVSILFLSSLLLPKESIDVKAATKTYTAYVTTGNATLNVRQKPSDTSKIIGKFKNRTKLVVIEKNKNGWTTVLYNNKKAYVATKYITPSYKQDTSLVYTYLQDGKKTAYKYKYNQGEWELNPGWDLWEDSNGNNDFVLSESSEGLYSGPPQSSYDIDLVYPIKKGSVRIDDFYGINYKILDNNATVKLKAGTFTQVVVVKITNQYATSVVYYAPYVGMILSKVDGKTYSQLVELKNR